MSEQLLTLAASLIAVLGLAGLALWLGLGRDPILASEAEAQCWANEVNDGFVAQQVALDRQGKGALLRNDAGDIMVLKPHGGHFAGRILAASASVRIAQGVLIVDCGEARFGQVQLNVSDSEVWANRINALGSASHV